MQLDLEISSSLDDIHAMAKKPTKALRKDGYAVAGVTHDGVGILKSGRATHFTDREVREAIAKVRAAASRPDHSRSK
jgi:hypothetical protein